MATTNPSFERNLLLVLDWAHGQDYAGYSKFDVFNSPILRLAAFHRYPRLLLTAAWSRLPISLRPWLGTTRSRNPKGIALFALAYMRRYRAQGQAGDLERAKQLLAWLDENHARGYSGKCWGYDHAWQSVYFYAPKDSPNIVVTGNVAYAFLEAYTLTQDQAYLQVARSAVDFMLQDLAAPIQSDRMRSIGYVPGNQWGVLNINGLAAAILIWTWQHTGESHLEEEARRLITFLVDKQTDYGAWHYAWPASSSNVKHDNYHTGNILDWILDYSRRSGDEQFLPNYERGLAFYRDHLFLLDGAPKWMSDQVYPFDAHSAAQSIVSFSKAAIEFDPTYLEDARRVATWSIANLQAPQGYFYYQKGRWWTKKYTLMRWCNAWMAFALSSLELAGQQLAGGKS